MVYIQASEVSTEWGDTISGAIDLYLSEKNLPCLNLTLINGVTVANILSMPSFQHSRTTLEPTSLFKVIYHLCKVYVIIAF